VTLLNAKPKAPKSSTSALGAASQESDEEKVAGLSARRLSGSNHA